MYSGIFRDRDYIQDSRGDIYQVLGSIHPPEGIFALQKYKKIDHQASPSTQTAPSKSSILEDPDPKSQVPLIWVQKTTGDRFSRQIQKYSSQTARHNISHHPYSLNSPLFGIPMIIISRDQIRMHWDPQQRFQDLAMTFQKGTFTQKQSLDTLERETLEIGFSLAESYGIDSTQIGVTGSILWQSQHTHSDIDIMVYGLSQVEKLFHASKPVTEDSYGLRRLKKIELYPLSQNISSKSGLSLEDAFTSLYRKPYLFSYRDRKVSVTFAPSHPELISMPQYVPQSKFHSIGSCRITAEVLDDRWGEYYPGLFELRCKDVKVVGETPANVAPAAEKITRLIIFEHDLAGYYSRGDTIEILGLLQRCQRVPGFDSPDLTDTYQILIGAMETFQKEYVKLV